jgi:lysophospholipase L1-like esterase
MAAAAAPALLANCSKDENPSAEKDTTTPHVTWDDPAQGTRILFQGDSVTEAGKNYALDHYDLKYSWGQGYVFAISSRLMADFPQSDLVTYNRGVGGNFVGSLKARWNTDALQLNPDVLSILIGVNHTITTAVAGADIESFETDYRYLLNRSKERNPDILFVLGLPFVMPVGDYANRWNTIKSDLDQRETVIRRLAAEFNAVVVDYRTLFEAANERKPYAYWAEDGVHPTMAGHELMAREWMKQVGERLSYFKKYSN